MKQVLLKIVAICYEYVTDEVLETLVVLRFLSFAAVGWGVVCPAMHVFQYLEI